MVFSAVQQSALKSNIRNRCWPGFKNKRNTWVAEVFPLLFAPTKMDSASSRSTRTFFRRRKFSTLKAFKYKLNLDFMCHPVDQGSGFVWRISSTGISTLHAHYLLLLSPAFCLQRYTQRIAYTRCLTTGLPPQIFRIYRACANSQTHNQGARASHHPQIWRKKSAPAPRIFADQGRAVSRGD